MKISWSLQLGFQRKASAKRLFYISPTEPVQLETDNSSKIVKAVLLDLSIAFDTLQHQILLRKLQSLYSTTSALEVI